MSRIRMQRRLTDLEQRSRPARGAPRLTWDLTCFTDQELDLILSLATKAEAAAGQPDWTTDEIAHFEHLERVYRDRCPSAA